MRFKSLKSVITISITAILSIFMVLIILYLKSKLENELYTSFENNALNLLKATENNVDSLYQDIQYYKKSIIKRKKEELKNYVAIACSIVENSYNNYKLGYISEIEAKKDTINHLKQLRYNGKVGYFWINDTNRPIPRMVMHPTVPRLDGKILDDEKFNCTKEKKENLFKAFVDISLKKGGGFVEYLWPKLLKNKLTIEQPKISYVKLFKEWNWIIGTGIYIDDIEAEVKEKLNSIGENLNKIILKQKIGKNGYFFIFNEDNHFIAHFRYSKKGGKEYLNPNTQKNILEELKKVAFTKNKTVDYYWDNIGDVGNYKHKKRAFVTYFKPLKWYIVSSIYLDDYQSYIFNLNKKLVIMGIIFVLIGLIFSIWISKKLTKPIFKLIQSFNTLDKDGIPLETLENASLLEIKILTSGFNKMISSIKESKAKKDELEVQLHQSRKMDAIGQLVGGIAHDFNNMLAGIINSSQLLSSENNNLDAKSKELIEIISLSADRARSLVSKLLSFSYKGKIVSSPIDVHSIIEDTVSILNKTIDKKISISFNKEATNSMVVGDDSQLQSTLINIAINASHAIINYGKILFETSTVYFDDNYFSNSLFEISKGEYIEIKIKDTGRGIKKELIDKIFEPFFTTKEQGKGTGLGLSVVYGMVKTHKGEIKVDSEIGKGTTFFIYLPCTERKNKFIKEDNIISEIVENSSILIVDDEEVIRITAKYILEKMGYNVLVAKDGLEAVEIYEKNKNSIVVVIMDMIMPKMNGTEAFYKIKEINNECKVIISSGFTKNENLQKLKEDGLSGFLAKPFRINDLKSILNKVFSENS